MDSIGKVFKFAQCNKHVQDSLDIIEKALLFYKIQNTCLSFNGGKDCTALLHLVHSVAKKIQSDNYSDNIDHQITAFYAQLPDHFEEESNFVEQTVKGYNLKLMQYSSNSLKESLSQLKVDAPHIQAIFIGTRTDDLKPGTHLGALAPTDEDWPRFMRINPILEWSYSQVWDFIRRLNVPYCDLYNQGYPSIGTKANTSKNSSLLRYDSNGKPYYLPAWNLLKSNEERLSRSTSLDVTNKE